MQDRNNGKRNKQCGKQRLPLHLLKERPSKEENHRRLNASKHVEKNSTQIVVLTFKKDLLAVLQQ